MWLFENEMKIKSVRVANKKNGLNRIARPLESFSKHFYMKGRVFIKIRETWQFGSSFNIIRYVFFVLAKKNWS
jgi:hypothetical protein